MFYCAEDYLVTSDPREGEQEENIVNFPCRFECPTPSPPSTLSLSRSPLALAVSFFILLQTGYPLSGRFKMPIKLTSSSWRRNDRRGHWAKSNSSVIRCKVARRTSFHNYVRSVKSRWVFGSFTDEWRDVVRKEERDWKDGWIEEKKGRGRK